MVAIKATTGPFTVADNADIGMVTNLIRGRIPITVMIPNPFPLCQHPAFPFPISIWAISRPLPFLLRYEVGPVRNPILLYIYLSSRNDLAWHVVPVNTIFRHPFIPVLTSIRKGGLPCQGTGLGLRSVTFANSVQGNFPVPVPLAYLGR